ncbi:MAG: LysR substrate-binding domain-containing protein [Sneathiella sp.]
MQELWKLISSPRHLIVFEAAARHASFTQAARELNVQQPAVSAAIKQLEDSLGVLLFERTHKKVSLTSSGQRFFVDVSKALDRLLTSAQTLHGSNQNNQVTLNASSAFNFYWMMPRLHDLRHQFPGIDLRLQTSDHEPNIDAENINLAIRRGSGDWEDCHSAIIANEVIYPIANPRVIQSAINLKTIANLQHERLIHLEEPIRERPNWKDWFAHFGVANVGASSTIRLNDYALVLQAAIAGEGFAFGWKHLTDPLIEQGLLAGRKEWSWETGLGFYLVWSRRKELSPKTKLVRDWILSSSKFDAP